jgi:hypothetical protein
MYLFRLFSWSESSNCFSFFLFVESVRKPRGGHVMTFVMGVVRSLRVDSGDYAYMLYLRLFEEEICTGFFFVPQAAHVMSL